MSSRKPKKVKAKANAKANDATIIALASEYHDYMDFRAAKENLDHDLDVKYYATYLAAGCVSFFGVFNDGTHLTRDDQKPEIFKEWQGKHEKDNNAIIALANEYRDYMNFRAAKEKLPYELDLTFYTKHLTIGVPCFFGVYHDGQHLTHDVQQPDVFKEWQTQRSSSATTSSTL